jgi:hypothetical protein
VVQLRRPDKSFVFGALILVAIVFNVVQFRAIDRYSPDNFDALRRESTADLLQISYRDCSWCRDRYGMHLALSFTAPGATVIVPTPNPYANNREVREEFTARAVALGRAADVHWVPLSAAVASLAAPSGFDPMRYVVATGPGGDHGAPWLLAVDPSHGPPGAVKADPGTYVDRGLAAEADGHPPAAPDAGQGRTFVLLRWGGAPNSTYGGLDALVELTLLPVPLRTALLQ